ncbi:hypothetical protein IQ255_02255 [Pleurocapsales cyanobacterium LEGE 10410]|nr:hypothetical protein [Pleurocapsales cyanobacterium LEGE 10410]
MKIYLPLLYSENIKRPGKKYFLNNIIGEDFIILLLSFTCYSSFPLLNAIGLFLLQLSFWCIYELGYIENDRVGEKFEDKAVLSYRYQSDKCSFYLWQPWVYSLVLSFLGIVVLSQEIAVSNNYVYTILVGQYSYNLAEILKSWLLWSVFLLVLRILFYIYNYINKQSRMWFYSLLQTCRYGGYLVLVSSNIVGLAFLLSVVVTRSFQYILYRYLGGESGSWPIDFPKYFFYFFIYLLLLILIAANERNLLIIINFPVLLAVFFCFVKGRNHFYKIFSQLIHISKDGSSKIN